MKFREKIFINFSDLGGNVYEHIDNKIRKEYMLTYKKSLGHIIDILDISVIDNKVVNNKVEVTFDIFVELLKPEEGQVYSVDVVYIQDKNCIICQMHDIINCCVQCETSSNLSIGDTIQVRVLKVREESRKFDCICEQLV